MFVEGGIIMLIAGIYFIPSIIAALRRAPEIGAVIVINLLLGWSVIGWIIALARHGNKDGQASSRAHARSARATARTGRLSVAGEQAGGAGKAGDKQNSSPVFLGVCLVS